MSLHKNRVKMTSATTGTGTLTLAAASSGYQSFATAYGADATVDILITEGTAWEVARDCAYTNSGATVSRGTLEASSTGSAVSFGGTQVVSVIATAERGNQLEMLSEVFGKTEISVTTTATATIGRMHHCTGTSANYTVTLPAASGNAGKLIGFRMGSASALTKLVTLDGNASEAIDGAATRVMWATETAILLCDGSNWHKVAGKSVAMSTRLSRVTDQTGISGSAYVEVLMTAQDHGAPAAMFDSGNSCIKILRPGNYLVGVTLYLDDTAGTMTFAYIRCSVNGTTIQFYQQSNATSGNAAGAFITNLQLSANDLVRAIAQHDATTARLLGAGGASLFATEVLTW